MNIPKLRSLLLLACLAGCQGDIISSVDYSNFVADSANGLKKTIRHKELTFISQYEPIDYVCLIQNRNNDSGVTIESLRKDYQDLTHFVFSFESSDQQTDPLKLAVYSLISEDIVSYLAFRVKGDFFIVYGLDTIPCLITHFERSYGITSRINLLLGFKESNFFKSDTISNFKLVYQDHLYSTGINSFLYLRRNIEEAAKLKPSL